MSESRRSNSTVRVQTRSSVPGVSWIWAASALLLLVFLFSAQLAPTVIEQRRDSGIFAYTGKVIAEGGRPYIDAWDNKLPGVYFINALAFVLFGTNRWALWLVENITLVATCLVMFRLLQRIYRHQAEAWTGTLILVLLARHPGLVPDTNFTEPYALLPQVIVFAAGYQFLREPRYGWCFLIGFAAAAAFLIKQTTVGVALTFIPAILISGHPVIHRRRRIRWLSAMVLGGVSLLGVVAAYLVVNGILDDALEASFVAASEFHKWVGRNSSSLIGSVYSTMTNEAFPVVFGPLLPFLIIGTRVAVKQAGYVPRRQRQPAANVTLGIWAALTFAVDLVLSNMTGRAYEHYYVTLIPATVLLVTLSLPTIERYRQRAQGRRRVLARGLQLVLLAQLVLLPLGATVVRFWMAQWEIAGPVKSNEIALYVAARTDPDETVLVWGADTAINFQSGRDAPTQYSYGYPLIVPGEATEENIRDMVDDLERGRPALIVDTTLRDGNRVPPLDPVRRGLWLSEGGRDDVANLGPIYQFVEDHCRAITVIDQAVVYHCRYTLTEGSPLMPLVEPLARGLDNFARGLDVDVRHGFSELYSEVSLGAY